jgi:hypothetical protein
MSASMFRKSAPIRISARTIVVQNARNCGLMRVMCTAAWDFHKLFHSFCEDRVTP